MEMTFIYGLYDPDGKLRYIGKSNNPKLRLMEHISNAKRGANNYKAVWIRKLLKQGIVPTIRVLEQVPVRDWEKLEIEWIEKSRQNGENLVNLSNGGNGSHGRTLTDVHKMKIGKALTGMKRGPHSEDHKRKLSKLNKGKSRGPMPLKTREKLRAANSGKKLSEDHKNKISKGLQGKVKKLSGEGLKSIREANKRRIWTKESRTKASISAKNRSQKGKE